MQVIVTAGTGVFPAGTTVTAISGNTFTVSAQPTTALSGATVTSYTYTITVGSTTNLSVGMHIVVTAGTGASTGKGSITYTSDFSAGSTFSGIQLGGSGILDVQNNVIGSITTANSALTAPTNFTGIYNGNTTGTINISNNTIGSTTELNSINASSTSTNSAQSLYGINNSWANGPTIISGHTISNMTNANTSTVASNTCGIRSSSSQGTKTVTNNTIRDLSSACGWSSPNYSPLNGISIEPSSLETQTVTGNTIYNLTNNYLSTGTSVCGIFFAGSKTSNTLSGNFIYNLSCLTAGNAIHVLMLCNSLTDGTTTCANNILSLGGNTPANIYGLYDYSGKAYNLYFNTVYIGGTLASGSTNSYVFYSATEASSLQLRNMINNIFMNARSNSSATGKHFAVYLAYPGNTSLTINYNDYFTSGTGGMLGYHRYSYVATYDISTLDAWKVATGQDANSMNTDPVFSLAKSGGTSAADFKPGVALVGVAGTGITTDYSGFTRLTPPTLGSIEKDNPLPVTLSSFTSNISGRNIKLSWITASEQNNSGFEILRAVVSSQYSVELDM